MAALPSAISGAADQSRGGYDSIGGVGGRAGERTLFRTIRVDGARGPALVTAAAILWAWLDDGMAAGDPGATACQPVPENRPRNRTRRDRARGSGFRGA